MMLKQHCPRLAQGLLLSVELGKEASVFIIVSLLCDGKKFHQTVDFGLKRLVGY